jgi:Protein of unknown function (DUF2786)
MSKSMRTEKVRKLRALAQSPNEHEAALALAKAQALELPTAKAIAHAIAQLLEARGMVVRVRRHRADGWPRSKVDADVSYRFSRARGSRHQIKIVVTEYP